MQLQILYPAAGGMVYDYAFGSGLTSEAANLLINTHNATSSARLRANSLLREDNDLLTIVCFMHVPL
jgi:hypothetical protein